jgi:HlyD family secretion protein
VNDLRVELDISQDNFAKISANQPCWIVTDAYPDKKYEGVVDLISPEANRQKATILVRVKVLNPDGLLKPDLNATVSFLSPKKVAATQASGSANSAAERPAIRVPATAVRDGAVFVVESSKALKRPVGFVKGAGQDVEIKTGLIGGEDLIISPPDSLQDGDKVKAAERR